MRLLSSIPGTRRAPNNRSMAAVFRSLAWPFVRVKVGRGHECVCSIVVVDVAAAGSVAVMLAR